MKEFKFYLAGPMGGIPSANIPAFDAAAADLRSRGYDITSPAELDNEKVRTESINDPTGLVHSGSWGEFLARDVKLLADSLNAVILLPGWHKSKGATLEVYVAMTCGHPLFTYCPERSTAIRPLGRVPAFCAILERLNVDVEDVYYNDEAY